MPIPFGEISGLFVLIKSTQSGCEEPGEAGPMFLGNARAEVRFL
jgi:hypothetical protein